MVDDPRVVELEAQVQRLVHLVDELQAQQGRILQQQELNTTITTPLISDEMHGSLKWAWIAFAILIPVALIMLICVQVCSAAAKQKDEHMDEQTDDASSAPTSAPAPDTASAPSASHSSADALPLANTPADAFDQSCKWIMEGMLASKEKGRAAGQEAGTGDGQKPTPTKSCCQRVVEAKNAAFEDHTVAITLALMFLIFCACIIAPSLFVPWLARLIHNGIDYGEVAGQVVPWRTNFYVGAYSPLMTLGFVALLYFLTAFRQMCTDPDATSNPDIKEFRDEFRDCFVFVKGGVAILFLSLFQVYGFGGVFWWLIVYSVFVAVLDGLLNFGLTPAVDLKKRVEDEQEEKKVENEETPIDWECPAGVPNIYCCLERSFTANLVTFSAQILLGAYYLIGLFETGTPDFSNTSSGRQTFFFYYSGIAVQVLLAYRSRHAKREEALFWKYMFQAMVLSRKDPEAYKPSYQTLSFENTTDGFDRKEVKLESWRLASRVTFSFLVNYVLQQLLVSSLPLMLCSSENYMDFVLNSAATIFIIELDDISGEDEFCVTIDSKIAIWARAFSKEQRGLRKRLKLIDGKHKVLSTVDGGKPPANKLGLLMSKFNRRACSSEDVTTSTQKSKDEFTNIIKEHFPSTGESDPISQYKVLVNEWGFTRAEQTEEAFKAAYEKRKEEESDLSWESAREAWDGQLKRIKELIVDLEKRAGRVESEAKANGAGGKSRGKARDKGHQTVQVSATSQVESQAKANGAMEKPRGKARDKAPQTNQSVSERL